MFFFFFFFFCMRDEIKILINSSTEQILSGFFLFIKYENVLDGLVLDKDADNLCMVLCFFFDQPVTTSYSKIMLDEEGNKFYENKQRGERAIVSLLEIVSYLFVYL